LPVTWHKFSSPAHHYLMVNLEKAVIFSFNSKDHHKAHLLEHCLGAYFLDHDLPLYKVKMHPLGVCALFDDEIPKFPTVSDLEPYIKNQKKRINIELLAALDTREIVIERLHQLQVENLADAHTKIEDILNWDTQKVLKDFERMYKTKVEATDLTATLPKVSSNTGFKPTKHKIRVPKLNPRLDAIEVAIRVPQTLDNFTCLMKTELYVKKELRKLSILSDLIYGINRHIVTLGERYFYFTFSPKARAGQGQKAIDSLIEMFKGTKIEREGFERWKKRIAEQTKEKWEKGELTDLWATELLLWRRILKPEDFESLDYQKIADLHQEFLSNPDNIYILTDF